MALKPNLALDIVQFTLDAAGIVDPTGLCDGISGLVSLGRGRWIDAAISAAGILPYIGDMAKVGKVPRYVRSVHEAVQVGSKECQAAALLRPALEKLQIVLNKVPLEKLPAHAQVELRNAKAEIGAFLQRRMYNPNPKHEFPGMAGRKGTRLDLSSDEAYQLLNDPARCLEVPGKKQFVAVKDRKIYVYQSDGAGGYHAYPSTGNEVCAKYPSVQKQVAGLLGVDVKRLSRME